MKDIGTNIRGLYAAVTINLSKALQMLKKDESTRIYPYDDADGKPVFAKGKLTVGIGRNLEANPLSELVIQLLLLEDLVRAEAGARRVLGSGAFDKLSENRKLAIVNLVFNLGEEGFSKFFSTIKCIKAADWEGARTNLLASKYANQVKGRASRVAAMLEKDEFPYE